MKKPRIIAAEYLRRCQAGEDRQKLDRWLEQECEEYDFPAGVRMTVDQYLHMHHRSVATSIVAGYLENLENGWSKTQLKQYVETKAAECPDPDLVKDLARAQLQAHAQSARTLARI